MLSARVQARIDPKLKEKAEAIMHSYGFNVSKLLTVIYSYIVKTNDLPIEMKKVPNDITKKAMKDKDVVGPFKSAKDLFNDLNA